MRTDDACSVSTRSAAGRDDRANEIVRVLRTHPGVREAAAVRSERAEWIAFIVANDSYLDELLDRKSLRAHALNRWRKYMDLVQFTKAAASSPFGFNYQSWNSSYTGKEVPASEMREWIQVTVSDIFQLAPKAVYEIGCGTGMILTRIAPHCDRYVAADFSPATLERLRAQLKALPALVNMVEVIERSADDFTGFAPGSFDTVVINSVVFFFPSLAYLTQVLEGAINIVRPGGRVFVGDIMSLPLMPLFASSVELFRAGDELSVSDIRVRIRRRVRLDPWLFISPAFFLNLPTQFPKLSRVEIQPRLGRADNEYTRYRYNAILHVGDTAEPLDDVEFEDWRERKLTLDAIRAILLQRETPFGIMRIPNARVERDVINSELLGLADPSTSVGELKQRGDEADLHGIHPQDLVDLSKEIIGLKVLLSWAACRSDGSYDVAFIPVRRTENSSSLRVCWPQPEKSEYMSLTSWPGQEKIKSDLLDSISAHFSQHLSADLAPSEIRLVDMLPKDERGAIDTDTLLRFMPS